LKNPYASRFLLLPVTPYYSLLLPITLSSPLLLSFFYFIKHKKKKKKLYKYIFIYKEGKFEYYTPLASLFFTALSGRQPKAGGVGNARRKCRGAGTRLCFYVSLFEN
jgi:hypothetical protein